MSVKIASLMITCKISRWVFSIKCLSSISSVNHAHNLSKSTQNVLNRSEIDPRIQYLKNDNGLSPDSLIKVLDSTHDLNSALKVFKWASLQKQFRHTAETYYRIIVKLGFAGNVDQMEGFCREMVRDRCHGAAEALGGLVDLFVGDGRLDEAIRVILVMNSSGFKPSLGKWNDLLGALVERERGFRDVLLVYKEMVKSGTLPNVDTLNSLIKALFDAKMVDKALDQFRRMKKKRCAPNCRTFEIVIHGLVATNLGDKALGVMNEMFEIGVNPDLRFYTSVIPLFCKENKPGEAMRLFDMMRTLEFEPDLCIYSSMVKCLCVKDLNKATELFHEMRNAGFSPSTDVLVDILCATCKLGNLDEARTLLDDSHVVDPAPYNVLLQGFCDAHYFLASKDLLKKMLNLDVVDHLSWNILILGLCNDKYVKQACVILGKMIILAYEPDFATYSALVIGNCNLYKYEDALKLFRLFSGKNWILDPNSYDKLIKGLCNVEKFEEASEVFMFMSSRNCSLHSSSFSSLIKGFSATGRVDEAIRLLKYGQSCLNPVNTMTYTAVMHGLLKLNRPYESLTFLSQILRRGLVLDLEAYCILIQCMIALRETNYCVLFFKEMVNNSLLPDSETLASLLSHLADHSQLHIIWAAIKNICQETEVIEPKVYNLIINGLCKEGYKSEACQLLDLMLEKGWVPDASTHGSLIGTVSNQEVELQISEPDMADNSVMQDEVSSILSEGLGEV
ncbi:putative pentatricopeptide repeat-containing protein At3g16710, mitochondrial [Chenopodium quinoa]|uniref:Pentatricopeptide repeat-containing protein n=1 Tax=Chenopodium quinoa TaxID=63459 RepID=A0A803L4M1_CHEQI|nr:putative pentatricopeptide repeat-containing protein At3g16710, mitochondrial [Chenopodium quinoa]XP_021734539.1 putative pentatricopeptide repeat-containing protein At3g16710, mitochondrial [Chenopodium quinoa]XP_021734540.1 putative pentatricopeptide repeat-containing protein At3g16710, mitochondrial [Chenopodium quinoa]